MNTDEHRFCARLKGGSNTLTEALTGDSHFEQAGFKALLA